MQETTHANLPLSKEEEMKQYIDLKNACIRMITLKMSKLKKKNGKPYQQLEKQLQLFLKPEAPTDGKFTHEEQCFVDQYVKTRQIK